ncbi:cell wall hydrolase [uncultured Sphingomonas sp.]|uniref:cell wall hydrolase n=1 Tax=uncultured Sphingomonas sp. TaxID=158754 RepID=UPI0035C9DC5E
MPEGPAAPDLAADAVLATSYLTLAAAVSAQVVSDEDDDELECLAVAVYYEAKGEPLAGQLAVADVILSRARSGRFPTSLCQVVTQPGQFSFVRGGRVPSPAPGPQYRTAMAIAKIAIADAWDNPAPQALYFHAKRVSPGWVRARVALIGNHIFYR